jgi:MFS family permease
LRAPLAGPTSVDTVSCAFAPLVFLGSFFTALAGMMLWGVGYATQDTLFKALIASVLPEGKRNLAFGLFYSGYGAGWLLGSVATGLLYDRSRPALIVFSIAAQLASMVVFAIAGRGNRRARTTQAG